ncbi:hypothetical protein Q1695_001166 [Nippostrongylus brasiliensis]|nr:hypothetical protein Q1695_001166 [Nippostrongylus brasiliensis]
MRRQQASCAKNPNTTPRLVQKLVLHVTGMKRACYRIPKAVAFSTSVHRNHQVRPVVNGPEFLVQQTPYSLHVYPCVSWQRRTPTAVKLSKSPFVTVHKQPERHNALELALAPRTFAVRKKMYWTTSYSTKLHVRFRLCTWNRVLPGASEPAETEHSDQCAVGCANCCPMGNTCINGGCCPLPQCPSGGLALSICAGRGCPVGTECVGGGCCQLPRCPSGLQATQRCQMGIGCARGHQCENGVCCAMPMCSTGMIASSVCGIGNSCPMGYVCEGRGCCQEPPPLCPNGGRASQRCNRGAECPPGFGCTPLGGCCLLSMEPVCPRQFNPICQCSPNSACPSGATCTMGTCCSKAVSLFNQIPGSQCHASTQCNGYSSSCAQCTQGVCACVNGAASNGASCLQMPNKVLVMARNGCDQYGSPCRVLLSTARRRPIIAPVGNITETPLFFNVANERRCVANATDFAFDPDSTCLPNEKCINGECKMKLWPGEYGCTTDEECTSRCANTYCERMKSDKNVAQCQCRDGQLLYGRCFSQCPQGFHESGAYCMHDNEDAFWADADAQDRLKALLNAGQC